MKNKKNIIMYVNTCMIMLNEIIITLAVVKPLIESKKKQTGKLTSRGGRGSYRHHAQQQQLQHGGGWGSEQRDSVFTGPGNIYEVYSDPDKLKNDLAQQPVV